MSKIKRIIIFFKQVTKTGEHFFFRVILYCVDKMLQHENDLYFDELFMWYCALCYLQCCLHLKCLIRYHAIQINILLSLSFLCSQCNVWYLLRLPLEQIFLVANPPIHSCLNSTRLDFAKTIFMIFQVISFFV